LSLPKDEVFSSELFGHGRTERLEGIHEGGRGCRHGHCLDVFLEGRLPCKE
jgi:hypothetical protein